MADNPDPSSLLPDVFSPATRDWFLRAFKQPTAVQSQTWHVAARGEHALVIAPTGSGKTLAAFLYALDRLFREGGEDTREAHKRKTSRILYISPIKATGTDVQRNLQIPLKGIADERRRRGETEVNLRVGIRTGDTPAQERSKLTRNPPDILITTPESLYLMLTSRARETLRGVETVIIDEVHAVAGSKRGAHLALSLERLDALLHTSRKYPGGFPSMQTLCRSMEDSGRIMRGRFVEGLGGAQFAERLTIDRLRDLATQATQTRHYTPVALSANDPANVWGNLLPGLHIRQRWFQRVGRVRWWSFLAANCYSIWRKVAKKCWSGRKKRNYSPQRFSTR